MAVRARRIFGPTQIAASGSATLYTVPSGRTAIVRFCQATNAHATTLGSLGLYLGSVADENRLHIFVMQGGTTSGNASLTLNPGDVLLAAASAAGGPFTVWGFGSLLDGAPE